MAKSQEIIDFTDHLTQLINPESKGLIESQTQGICTTCPNPATDFRDALSQKEYRISGMCQNCQDKTFGV